MADPALGNKIVLPMILTGAGPSTPMRLQIEALAPEAAELQACLVEALEHSKLPPIDGEGVVALDYELTLEPRAVERRLHVLEPSANVDVAVSHEDDPSFAPDPLVTEPMQHVYSPTPEVSDILAARTSETPKSLRISTQYCVDETGRTEQIEILDSGRAPKIEALVVKRVREWRAKPASVDGQPVTACTRKIFTFDFVWRG